MRMISFPSMMWSSGNKLKSFSSNLQGSIIIHAFKVFLFIQFNEKEIALVHIGICIAILQDTYTRVGK